MYFQLFDARTQYMILYIPTLRHQNRSPSHHVPSEFFVNPNLPLASLESPRSQGGETPWWPMCGTCPAYMGAVLVLLGLDITSPQTATMSRTDSGHRTSWRTMAVCVQPLIFLFDDLQRKDPNEKSNRVRGRRQSPLWSTSIF